MQNAFAQKPRPSDFAARPDLAPREQGFQTMTSLPKIMVAPNGARLTKADHPALPVTIDETVACAIACRNAGADGLHAHVRDAEQRHVLDAGLYSELLAEMTRQLPGFYAQITTEAVGQYSPAQQRSLVETVRPKAVSIGLREIDDEPDAEGCDPEIVQHLTALMVGNPINHFGIHNHRTERDQVRNKLTDQLPAKQNWEASLLIK